MDLLVSTEWLAKELGASDLRIVDATWHMPDAGRNAAAEYEGGHIPGAVFMDLAEIADSNSSLPNMLPPPEKFASRMQSLGLGDGSRIVVYDDSVFKSATRAWWMLTLFGAHDVAHVLGVGHQVAHGLQPHRLQVGRLGRRRLDGGTFGRGNSGGRHRLRRCSTSSTTPPSRRRCS